MSKTANTIKKIIVGTLLATILVACCTSNNRYQDIPKQDTTIQSSEFNQEQYIWQIFLFPTNRTSGRQ